MSIIAQSRAFGGLVTLSLTDEYFPLTEIAHATLSPNEARLLSLELIREADKAENQESA